MPAARKSNKNALQDASSNVLNRKPYSHEDQFPRTTKKPRTTATEPDFLTEVILPGETAGLVRVFDDCNTIRSKIRALLADGVKQTHFLKWVGGVNPNSYRQFMSHNGIMDGANMGFYYSAYVFFEKKRIYEGDGKSDLRMRQETAFPQGRDMESLRRTHVWVGPGATVRWDSLGRRVITTNGVARKFS